MGKTAKISFRSKVQRPEGVGTWHYADVPVTVSQFFGARGHIYVAGTLNGKPFSGSMVPQGGGRHIIVLNSAARERIGLRLGDPVEFEIERDDSARAVEVPPELAKELKRDGGARRAFDSLSYSHKKEYVSWIEEARREDTRIRRSAMAVRMLQASQRPPKSRGTS
jgi:bifunctional DNA-binding transcriptional regulator/antitoxin component of YhaV-PrlF toxin-antitoxin module